MTRGADLIVEVAISVQRVRFNTVCRRGIEGGTQATLVRSDARSRRSSGWSRKPRARNQLVGRVEIVGRDANFPAARRARTTVPSREMMAEERAGLVHSPSATSRRMRV